MQTASLRVSSPAIEAAKTQAFVLVLVGASLLFSRTLACATPFAALAALAGSRLGAKHALWTVLLAWSANQAIGFGLLGYPHTWTTIAWGGAIGLAALAATVPALILARASTRVSSAGMVAMAAVGLAAGFAVYEGVLFAATAVLPSTHAAFSLPIIARIGGINALAYLILQVLQHLARRFGLEPQVQRLRPL